MSANQKLTEIYDHYKQSKAAKKLRNDRLRKRAYAFICDLYIIVFANKALSFVWLSFINNYVSNISTSPRVSTFTFQAHTTNLSLAIMFFSYFFFSYYLGNGQTLGKAFFKLKVVSSRDMTEELSALDCFGRSIGYVFASLLAYLPLALNFVRKDQKGVQDFISHTHVVCMDDFEYALAQAEVSTPEEAQQIALFEEVS
ncbi:MULTISPECIES: RDD family protein [Halobacteriovorax]|uniref:RDD domain-containing protein n=1 Tax=Halobacteriovorax vibrionivorans TaxID=2152716 RepID=A0ABY0IIW2_9BACT|nr:MULTISPECIES: RDD family protein [Halobacteriovorax]AYF45418.1 RDD family protein [Halobacteriovorax sp. BALOs_7]RZF22500.1 hypothetical protein DAY19_01640 [Halobacteriovorax vibrionivorans]TGD47692.1 hypothetical protein EP118_07005 [Halobacteriovorax sp. Y22]